MERLHAITHELPAFQHRSPLNTDPSTIFHQENHDQFSFNRHASCLPSRIFVNPANPKSVCTSFALNPWFSQAASNDFLTLMPPNPRHSTLVLETAARTFPVPHVLYTVETLWAHNGRTSVSCSYFLPHLFLPLEFGSAETDARTDPVYAHTQT